MRPLFGPVGALMGVDFEAAAADTVVGAGGAAAMATLGLASFGGVGAF